MHERRLTCFRDRQIDGFSSTKFTIRPRGIEMRVVRNNAALPTHYGEQNMFRGAPLMRGDDVTETEDALYSGAETLKTRGSGVGFVAAHHGGPLFGGHCGRTGISEEVNQYGIRRNGEQVVTGL